MRKILLLVAMLAMLGQAQDGITSRIRSLQLGIVKSRPAVELRSERKDGHTVHLGMRLDTIPNAGALNRFAEQYLLQLALHGEDYQRYLAADGVELWTKGKKLDTLNKLPLKAFLGEVAKAPMAIVPGPERWSLRWTGVSGLELRFPLTRDLVLGMDKTELDSAFGQWFSTKDTSLARQWMLDVYKSLGTLDSAGRKLAVPALKEDTLSKDPLAHLLTRGQCPESVKDVELRQHGYAGSTRKQVVPCREFLAQMAATSRLHLGFEEGSKDTLKPVLMLVDRWFKDSDLLYGSVPKDWQVRKPTSLGLEIFTFVPDSEAAPDSLLGSGGKAPKFRIAQ